MIKERNRKIKLEFYVTEEEKTFIKEKMKVSKIKNMSAFLRKAAIDGKILINDYSELKQINYNLHKIGANINQIAFRVNQTNSIFKDDIKDLQNKMEEIWLLQKSILSRQL